jgi:hypothetical protein
VVVETTIPTRDRRPSTGSQLTASQKARGADAHERRRLLHRSKVTALALVIASFTASLCVGGESSSAVGESPSSAKASCSQLTKAQVQPLIVNPITSVTVKPVTQAKYTLEGTKKVGQECVFAAGSSDSDALVVTVVGGPVAAVAYRGDVQGLDGVRVPGVGDKALRARVDSNGAAATLLLTSMKGDTYCSVLPQDNDIPDVGQLEEAAGATADIGDKAYAEIADAIGTVCNRIYGSGTTKPDLSSLIAAGTAAASAPTTTSADPLGSGLTP